MRDFGLVSIITPAYNAASYIGEAIESVLKQTYTRWELLICDDCSKDDTVNVVKQFCAQDCRIRLLTTAENTGSPSIPRNIALNEAEGNYIALLDADDIWLPKKLEEQLSFMEKYHYEFVYSNYEKMDFQGKRKDRFVCTRNVSTFWDILESNGIPCLTTLLRREIIGDIRFKQYPKEDYVFWLEILRTKGITAYNTNKIHAVYREAKNSRSGNKVKMIKQQWYILRVIEKVKKIPAIYFMSIFLIKGFLKYLK